MCRAGINLPQKAYSCYYRERWLYKILAQKYLFTQFSDFSGCSVTKYENIQGAEILYLLVHVHIWSMWDCCVHTLLCNSISFCQYVRAPVNVSEPWSELRKQLFRWRADYWTSPQRKIKTSTHLLPPCAPILTRSPSYYRALSKWQSAFVLPQKSSSHSFPTHSPTTKEPSCCGADWGKGIDKTLVGKVLSLCQVFHAVNDQKDWRAPWPCLFVYASIGADLLHGFLILRKEKEAVIV